MLRDRRGLGQELVRLSQVEVGIAFHKCPSWSINQLVQRIFRAAGSQVSPAFVTHRALLADVLKGVADNPAAPSSAHPSDRLGSVHGDKVVARWTPHISVDL